jgi:hypothetical protein
LFKIFWQAFLFFRQLRRLFLLLFKVWRVAFLFDYWRCANVGAFQVGKELESPLWKRLFFAKKCGKDSLVRRSFFMFGKAAGSVMEVFGTMWRS